ncbi:hypothetical protein OUZ56_004930 [Daphnia magna]|uniref:Uncharacterized protein n=1 Tax=Daphnia magna TaxID=35525 RepID=A0ABQ9YRA5_9CRUS|nr:hypothetical protein OUZ56_004930 [Daphnia magna]
MENDQSSCDEGNVRRLNEAGIENSLITLSNENNQKQNVRGGCPAYKTSMGFRRFATTQFLPKTNGGVFLYFAGWAPPAKKVRTTTAVYDRRPPALHVRTLSPCGTKSPNGSHQDVSQTSFVFKRKVINEVPTISLH